MRSFFANLRGMPKQKFRASERRDPKKFNHRAFSPEAFTENWGDA
jgi:hypothetical protein